MPDPGLRSGSIQFFPWILLSGGWDFPGFDISADPVKQGMGLDLIGCRKPAKVARASLLQLASQVAQFK